MLQAARIYYLYLIVSCVAICLNATAGGNGYCEKHQSKFIEKIKAGGGWRCPFCLPERASEGSRLSKGLTTSSQCTVYQHSHSAILHPALDHLESVLANQQQIFHKTDIRQAVQCELLDVLSGNSNAVWRETYCDVYNVKRAGKQSVSQLRDSGCWIIVRLKDADEYAALLHILPAFDPSEVLLLAGDGRLSPSVNPVVVDIALQQLKESETVPGLDISLFYYAADEAQALVMALQGYLLASLEYCNQYSSPDDDSAVSGSASSSQGSLDASPLAPVLKRKKSLACRLKGRPKTIRNHQEILGSSTDESVSSPAMHRDRIMTIFSGGSSVPSASPRIRASTFSRGAKTCKISGEEIKTFQSWLVRVCPKQSQDDALRLLYRQHNDDDVLTVRGIKQRQRDADVAIEEDELEAAAIASFESGAFGQIQQATDLRDRKSILWSIIETQYPHLRTKPLPAYEIDGIYNACMNILNNIRGRVAFMSNDEIRAMLNATVEGYRPVAADMMPSLKKLIPYPYGLRKFPETVQDFLASSMAVQSEVLVNLTQKLEQVAKVLYSSPYHRLATWGYEGLIKEVTEIRSALNETVCFFKQTTPLSPTVSAALEVDIKALNLALDEHLKMLKVIKCNDYRSVRNAQESINCLFLAGEKLVNQPQKEEVEKKRKASLRGKSNTALKTLKSNYAEAMSSAVTMGGSGCWKNMISCLLGYQDHVIETLGKAGLDDKFNSALIETLQQVQGRSYTKNLLLKSAGQYYPAQVKYDPACCIRAPSVPVTRSPEEDLGLLDFLSMESMIEEPLPKKGSCDPFVKPYDGKLCPSMERGEAEHCVNLMTVTMTLKDTVTLKDTIKKEGKPEHCDVVIYDEVRVGIPYAWGVDRRDRRRVTDLRWQEILTAVLISKWPEKLKVAMMNPDGHTVIELPILYSCLLSPDIFRRSGIISDNDQKWVEKTWQKVQELNDLTSLKLQVRDCDGGCHYIRVKPKIFMIVCPCNEFAFHKYCPALGSWWFADNKTTQTFIDLFGAINPDAAITGYAGTILSRLEHTTKEAIFLKQEIEELIWLIRLLFHDKTHHKLLPEPMFFYNLVTQLGRALDLANLIGCKSAKDRTGNKSQSDMKMAFECYMARKLLMEGQVFRIIPSPFRWLTEEDHFNSCQLTLNSGQCENQIRSTAFPGYKMRKFMLGIACTVYDAIRRDVRAASGWWRGG